MPYKTTSNAELLMQMGNLRHAMERLSSDDEEEDGPANTRNTCAARAARATAPSATAPRSPQAVPQMHVHIHLNVADPGESQPLSYTGTLLACLAVFSACQSPDLGCCVEALVQDASILCEGAHHLPVQRTWPISSQLPLELRVGLNSRRLAKVRHLHSSLRTKHDSSPNERIMHSALRTGIVPRAEWHVRSCAASACFHAQASALGRKLSS